jgi:hypothetical protein
VGFDKLDSFNSAKAFAFIYRKGDNGFIPVSTISQGIWDMNYFKPGYKKRLTHLDI